MPEPRAYFDESVYHTKMTYRAEYPKTEKRHAIGNLPTELHTEYSDFCDKYSLGHAEAIAALLDFVMQHEDAYGTELAAIRAKARR